jgi:hypothetical protein
MPKCIECCHSEDPSPTIIRCRIKNLYLYTDTEACKDFKGVENETEMEE